MDTAKQRRRWRKFLARETGQFVYRSRYGRGGCSWRDAMRWAREGRVEAFVTKVDLLGFTGPKELFVQLPGQDPWWSSTRHERIK